jgi:hypothetical protein
LWMEFRFLLLACFCVEGLDWVSVFRCATVLRFILMATYPFTSWRFCVTSKQWRLVDFLSPVEEMEPIFVLILHCCWRLISYDKNSNQLSCNLKFSIHLFVILYICGLFCYYYCYFFLYRI